ncbi:hypothetical protein PABG_04059 [Paracoccidioides brasiliensis Pb03]|nr:hypothetical protein PABG_04059 [Paracoccidioides brasiliensis Pb03]
MSLSPPPPSPQTPLSLPPSNQNPKKRPLSMPSSTHISHKKARMHPLRQTSFPSSQDSDPRVYSARAASVKSEADGGSVTGSVTGLFAASVDGSGNARGKKRKKGGAGARKEKETETERDGTASVKGTTVDGGVEVDGGGEEVDEDGDGDEGDMEEVEGEGEDGDGPGTAREAEAERKNLAILIDAFTPAQSTRYDFFKRAKLNKPMVRKIVNQTLSQSVPPNVITTISGYTKVFVGELVEKARTVQEEWAEAADRAAYAEYEAELAREEKKEEEKEEEEAPARAREQAVTTASTQSTQPTTTTATNAIMDSQTRTNQLSSSAAAADMPSTKTDLTGNDVAVVKTEPSSSNSSTTASDILKSTTTPPSPSTQPQSQPQTQAEPKRKQRLPFKPPPNPHRGQLLPSHLREALRRYKRDGEGGGVGFGGLSMGGMGVKGSFSCGIRGVGGRRLFQ